MGYVERDLSRLGEYCRLVSRSVRSPDSRRTIPCSGATRSAPQTGVHAAAADQGVPEGRPARWLDAVYCGVPAALVGREQEIEIGPMSGRSNVVYWLEHRGLRLDE